MNTQKTKVKSNREREPTARGAVAKGSSWVGVTGWSNDNGSVRTRCTEVGQPEEVGLSE
jgi:hypothetical protein